MKELLPRTARAWAALAVIAGVVAAVSFGIDDAAGITALGVVTGLALLNLGRVARWVEPDRLSHQVKQAQLPHTRELRASLDSLSADLEVARGDVAKIAEQMSSLRLTVAHAASAIAEQRGDAG